MFTVCRVSSNPTSPPKKTHTRTAITMDYPLYSSRLYTVFLKLYHCVTVNITLGPGEGAAATNQ